MESGIPPVIQLDHEEIKKMIEDSVALQNNSTEFPGFPRYVYSRNESGIHIIDIRKQFERIQLATRCKINHDDLELSVMKDAEKIKNDIQNAK